MKVRLAIILITLFVSTLSFGQSLSIGPKAGINGSLIRGSVKGRSALAGFHIGQTTNIKLGSNLALAFDLLFSMQGGEFTTEDRFPTFNSSRNSSIRLRLYNANLPVYVKIYPDEEVGFNFQFGVQPGIIVRARTGDDGLDRATEDVSVMDFSVPFGFGIDFSNGMGIDVRYTLGLTDIEEDKGDEYNYYSDVLQIGMFYRFGN